MNGEAIGIKMFKNPYSTQYVAPYRYCFFNLQGQKLGRIIWENNVEGVYCDRCDEEWGL
jgi:hypothetical protein